MGEDLLQRLRIKLAHLNTDPLARQRTPRARLSEDSAWDPETGTIRGSIEVVMDREGGEESVLFRAQLEGVATEEAADDRLAEALSRVLMDHRGWPK